jgi:hypothetical protein
MNKLLFLILLIVSCIHAIAEQKNAEVIGTWEGESRCTVRPSPCNDEHVIYDIAKTDGGDQLKISMDKVVDGKRLNMGELPCSYESPVLKCTHARGNWEFAVEGKKMTGTLRLTDGTIYRRILAAKR